MEDRKEKTKVILIGAFCVAVVVACVILIVSAFSGKDDRRVCLRITNQSDGGIYEYWISYSYQGKVHPRAEYAIGINKNYGYDSEPIEVGERVKLELEPVPESVAETAKELTMEIYVFDKPIHTPEGQELENSVKIGDVHTIPLKPGKYMDIVITGSRENGYELEFTGFSGRLFN